MVKVQVNEEHCIYYDGYLKSNLENVKKDVRKRNFDSFICITGREGYGKSTFAFQVAMFLDPTFDLDRVCFTPDQFVEAVQSAKKFEAIVLDESVGWLSSRGSMSKFNKQLIKIFSEMRSKNLFVILVIPSFFELDKYPAIHRSTGLIHVSKRGYFGCYDYPTKRKLYYVGKKTYTYSVKPNFIGRFTAYFPLDEEAYEEKKQKAINEWTQIKSREEHLMRQKDIMVGWMYEKGKLTQDQIAELIGDTQPNITRILKKNIT